MNRTGYEVDVKLRNEFSPSDYTGMLINKAEYENIFKAMDLDKDGVINRDEILKSKR